MECAPELSGDEKVLPLHESEANGLRNSRTYLAFIPVDPVHMYGITSHQLVAANILQEPRTVRRES